MRPTSFTSIAVPMLLNAMLGDPTGDLEQISKRVVREAYRESFGAGREPAEPLMEVLRQKMLREAAAASLRATLTVLRDGGLVLTKLMDSQLPGKHRGLVTFISYAGATMALQYGEEAEAAIKALSPPESMQDMMFRVLGIPAQDIRVERVADDEPPDVLEDLFKK